MLKLYWFSLAVSMLLAGSAHAGYVMKLVGKKKIIVKLTEAEMAGCASGGELSLAHAEGVTTAKILRVVKKRRQLLVRVNRGKRPESLKKRTNVSATCTGEMDSASASTSHGGHKPYQYEVDASFGYSSSSGKSKVASLESETKYTTNAYEISLSGFYILRLGAFALGVGPEISYGVTTDDRETSSSFGDPEKAKTTTTSIGYGPLLKAYIGDVDHSVWLPFAGLSYLITNNESKTDETTTKSDGSSMSLIGGVHYFVVPHVSVTPQLAYIVTSSESTSGEFKTDVEATAIQLRAGLSIFL